MTTQLVRDVMREMADAGVDVTEMHWFDATGMFEAQTHQPQDPLHFMRPPFSKCAVVWHGSSPSYKNFAMHMIVAGTDPEEGIVISATRCPPGGRPVASPLLVYALDEGQIKYGPAEEGDTIDRKEAEMILGFVSAWYGSMVQRSTAYVPSVAQTFTNRRKIAQGKVPSYDWHTVVIEAVDPKSESKGGTHASPRLHDRRGHIRRLRSGKNVWVKPCKVGDPTKGIVWKDYVLH